MHVMLDLETMGTRPNAPIIAIGAVMFDGNGVVDQFYRNIDLASAVELSHAVIDPKTVEWWMEQSEGARLALRNDKRRILEALIDFKDWIEGINPEGVWGNGVGFDNMILSETYHRLNMTPPWGFWVDRCYRTVKAMYKHIPVKRVGTYHNALDDARTQAEHLVRIWGEGMEV